MHWLQFLERNKKTTTLDKKPVMKMISERLKKLRDESGLTQAQLGKLIDVNPRSIGHYEQGIRGGKNYDDMLVKIADYFNVSIDYLYGRTNIRSQAGTTLYYSGNVTDEKKREVISLITKNEFTDEQLALLKSLIESWK